MGDPLNDLLERLEDDELAAEGRDRFVIEVEELLGITVDYIDDEGDTVPITGKWKPVVIDFGETEPVSMMSDKERK